MRRALRNAAGIAALTLTAAGLTATAVADEDVSAPAPSSSGDITWSTCADEEMAEAGIECGDLAVPLDRDEPAGRQVSVAVSRLAAAAPAAEQQGPLLVNFGGPGGTGLDAPLFFKDILPADVLATYDVIGFDPRGLGASTPLLSCGGEDPLAYPQPDPRFRAGLVGLPGLDEQRWLSRFDAFVAGCDKESGDLLAHHTSTDVVADMDAIRVALGAEHTNFFGFSYGTYLGQLYAATYPERTRRAVLDANIDPSTWGYPDIFITARGMDEAAQQFFGWLADHDDDYGLGTSAAEVAATFFRVDEELRQGPLEFVGPAEWNALVAFATYSQDIWPIVGIVLSDAATGDTALLEELFAPFEYDSEEEAAADADAYDNFLAVNAAALCGDSTWPGEYARWRADGVVSQVLAPIGTANWLFASLQCRVWPYQKPLAEVDGAGAPPLLLTTTAVDPATPLLNSLSVRLQYPDSVLLLDTGTIGHTATLGGNDCVDDQVFAYLRDGTLPVRNDLLSADAACPGRPLPSPDDVILEAEGEETEGEETEGEERVSVAAMRRMMGLAGPARPADMMEPGADAGDPAVRRAAAIAALQSRVIAGQLRGHAQPGTVRTAPVAVPDTASTEAPATETETAESGTAATNPAETSETTESSETGSTETGSETTESEAQEDLTIEPADEPADAVEENNTLAETETEQAESLSETVETVETQETEEIDTLEKTGTAS